MVQQNGAMAHTARRTMDVLRELFPGHLISLRGADGDGWPARSPDLTPSDFFFKEYLKAKVFDHHPRTIYELKAAILQEIAGISLQMTARVGETSNVYQKKRVATWTLFKTFKTL